MRKLISLGRLRGDRIPQHPLLSKAQWDYLIRDGRIRQFSYWTTYGPYARDGTINAPHAERVTIKREDYKE